MFIAPGDEEDQADAGANRGISEVEGGKAEFAAAAALHIKVNEINDRVAAGQKTVGEIAGNATKDETKGDLAGQRVGVEMMPRIRSRVRTGTPPIPAAR